MQTAKTLTLKKSAPLVNAGQNQLPERSLVGKAVTLQTRSPTRITGTIQAFENGWIVIAGTERRWQSDGSLSDPVTTGTFTLERAVIMYIAEVA